MGKEDSGVRYSKTTKYGHLYHTKKKWSGFRYKIIYGILNDNNGANATKVDANNGAYIEGEVAYG